MKRKILLSLAVFGVANMMMAQSNNAQVHDESFSTCQVLCESINVQSHFAFESNQNVALGENKCQSDCQRWAERYNKQESVVIKIYNSVVEAKQKKYSTASRMNLQKTYRQAQQYLRQIRMDARAEGCTLSASSYESARP